MNEGVIRSCRNCEHYDGKECAYFDEIPMDLKPCCHWKNECTAILSDKVAGVYPITVCLDRDEYLLTKEEAVRLHKALGECLYQMGEKR